MVARPSGLSEMFVEASDPVQEVLVNGKHVTTHHRGSDHVCFVGGAGVDSGQVPSEYARPLVVHAHLQYTIIIKSSA